MQVCSTLRQRGWKVAREVLEGLEGKHCAVERNESCQAGQEAEPSLPCCRVQWWEEQQGWLQGHSGINQPGKSRSLPLLCCAICDAEETLQSCQCRCCAEAANTPTTAGVQYGLPREPVLTCGLPALLQPGSLSAAMASSLSHAAVARQPILLRTSPC